MIMIPHPSVRIARHAPRKAREGAAPAPANCCEALWPPLCMVCSNLEDRGRQGGCHGHSRREASIIAQSQRASPFD